MKKLIILLLLLLVCRISDAQVVSEDVSNKGIYEFLDELAALKVIALNSAIKPYSREYIAQKLGEARMTGSDTLAGKNLLSKRQLRELDFYCRDYLPSPVNRHPSRVSVSYSPVGVHYRDSLFTFSLRPVAGISWMTNANQSAYHRWWGASMFGSVGKHFGFYASLRDNTTSTALARPDYFTREEGNVYKEYENGKVDFSEMRAGVTASVKWGSIGLLHDRPVWGDAYHGTNILSGKAPAFPYLYLHLNPVRWFEFSYLHGWLNSNVIDSSRSYYNGDVYRIVYRSKFIAANMYTFIPWRGLNLSVGNSIIYSDININPMYLIPFLFFNAADATKNNYINDAGSNSQLFFNFSSRQIRHLHLFVSFFIDEWKMSRVMKKNLHNFTSLKAGFRVNDFLVRNFALGAEYTRTQPMTYRHYIETTTYASNNYGLGHYLQENSEEIAADVSWRPIRGVKVEAMYVLARHGDDVPYVSNAGYAVDQVPFLKNKTWQRSEISLTARYEFTQNAYFLVGYRNSAQEGSAWRQSAIERGTTQTIFTSLNIGF
ncbi:MAG TPA: hypothetical protein PKG48_03225 [Bacteroidales bacterium]|nr:hypothetical protein [Bacteroidales bacterium]HPS61837.1 hypothetical protein [Bacteroidales bacterium]